MPVLSNLRCAEVKECHVGSMKTLAKSVLLTAVAAFLASNAALYADSSTPPTREGFTPGTNPRDAACSEWARTTVAPAHVAVEWPTQHRLSQGMN